MQDLYGRVGVVHLLDPADLAHTTTKSSIIDLAYNNKPVDGAIIAVGCGTLTGVDGSNYATITMQESDTTVDGDFATVAAGSLSNAFTVINSTSKDNVTQWVGYRGSKRYIRAVITFTGTGITAGVWQILGIVGAARDLPISAIAATAST